MKVGRGQNLFISISPQTLLSPCKFSTLSYAPSLLYWWGKFEEEPEKLRAFMFYEKGKQMTMNFSFSFWTWILFLGIEVQ